MKTMAIIGSQWGDEGKGKITDLLGQKCDIVVRFQGGNNAGHTIIVEDKTSISLRLSPTALLADKLVPFKSVVPLIVLMLEVPFGLVALSKFNIPTPYTSSTPASPMSVAVVNNSCTICFK